MLKQSDVMDIYLLTDKLVEIFHDPDRKRDVRIINKFKNEYFPLIDKLYHHTLWDELSEEQKQEIQKQPVSKS